MGRAKRDPKYRAVVRLCRQLDFVLVPWQIELLKRIYELEVNAGTECRLLPW